MKAEYHRGELRSVLVVDDDGAIGELLRRNLKDSDTRVIEAASGMECLEALQRHSVDLALLGVRLPDFSGWGVLSLLRLTEALRDLPVIVISKEPPNTALMKRLLPDDYVRKPFDMRDLLERMRRVTVVGGAKKGAGRGGRPGPSRHRPVVTREYGKEDTGKEESEWMPGSLC